MIREQPVYRREVFLKGLQAAGHKIVSMPGNPDKDTLLLIWNRYGGTHELALRVEAAGGAVLVAENGYLSAGGGSPKFDDMQQANHYFALARNYHNGNGTWHVGEEDRFSKLGVQIKPWREDGEYILVCPNRSFGVPSLMMHPDWPERFAAKLRKATNVPVVVRNHPGNDAPKVPLSRVLAKAQAVAIWYSSAGVHALVEGVPVICESPNWICKETTFESWKQLKTLGVGYAEREKALHRMAWAQWNCEEIESGEPFRHLLPAA